MPRYELYEHAGRVPYAAWKESGIVVPIFDKDGTLTHANKLEFVDEVIEELAEAELPDIFPDIAVVSNNHDHSHVDEFATSLRARLGVGVYAISRAQGFASKPKPEMGLKVAEHFDVTPRQLGVVGDRLLTDVKFGHNLGASAVALCAKAGEGDAIFVPVLRILERGMVAFDRVAGRATKV